jgi:glutaminase
VLSRSELNDILNRVWKDIALDIGKGRVADYIPALASISPKHMGIAIVTCDGTHVQAGDGDMPFSIQSVSKAFALTLALDRVGEALWKRVGREPSGSAFNSIVQLEHEHGIPRNPFINAGALVVDDVLLANETPDYVVDDLIDFLRSRADDTSVDIDHEVAKSEAETGHRNRALAHFMRAYGTMTHDIDDVLSVYFRQCALSMSCCQLAHAGLYLANDGVDPFTNETVLSVEQARRINAIMMTCGHYDASGEFAFKVGLPGKSGVGGGILAIAPHKASIAVWSPGLNEFGNSLVGTLALEKIAAYTGWSVF